MKENKNNFIQIPLSKNRLRHSLALAGFIILLGVGLFGSAGKAEAATMCTDAANTIPTSCTPGSTMGWCMSLDNSSSNQSTLAACPGSSGMWSLTNTATPAGADPTKSVFENTVDSDYACGFMPGKSLMPGCLVQLFYYLLYIFPAYLLEKVAYFFNVLISVTLGSTLFKHQFVSDAWGIVRDLSNIFFILILLYIAVKIILGLGGSDVKKMIAKVIIVALLINFSMFFTQVIIDTSNILALIFYNKINVNTMVAGQSTPRPYSDVNGEKDVSGGMVAAFNPTATLGQPFFEASIKQFKADGTPAPNAPKVPVGTILGLIFMAGLVMCIAIYALFISGISFLGRLIELWILIIFSPFAFMSSTVPLFSGVEYLGWDSWIKRLLKVAFMAPIFMFFLYFIFMLIKSSIFKTLIPEATTGTTNPATLIKMILGIVMPTIFICILLLKATEYAKKGSGVIGEKLMAGAKMVGGLALGAATGGTAFLASNSAGRIARNIANDDELKAKATAGDKGAQRKLSLANSVAKSSFDFRQTGVGKFAAKKSGMDFNQGLGAVGLGTENLKGGRKERDKEAVAKHEENVKSYQLSKAGEEKQKERKKEYEEDKDEAKKNVNDRDDLKGKTEEWEEKYRTARSTRSGGKPLSEAEEKEFKKEYEVDHKPPVSSFKEEEFRKAYENGDNKIIIESFGINKRKDENGKEKDFEKGSVKDAKGVNEDRRKAYAYSLQYPNAKIDKNGDITRDENGNVVRENIRKGLGGSFVSGAAGMLTTPTGLAISAATLGLAVPLGGLATAIKDLVKTQAQQRIPLFTEHKEIIAGVRKGVNPDDKLSALIKKAAGKDEHAAAEAVKEIIKDAKTADDGKKEGPKT